MFKCKQIQDFSPIENEQNLYIGSFKLFVAIKDTTKRNSFNPSSSLFQVKYRIKYGFLERATTHELLGFQQLRNENEQLFNIIEKLEMTDASAIQHENKQYRKILTNTETTDVSPLIDVNEYLKLFT